MPQFEIEFTQVNHSDARQCPLFCCLVEVPMCWTVFKFTPYLPVTVVVFFKHTLEHENLFCGSPWRRDHLDTTHSLWVSAQTPFFYHFLFEVTCRATFESHADAHYCKIHHSRVDLQKHSIFQNRVYTFLFDFRLGWCFFLFLFFLMRK